MSYRGADLPDLSGAGPFQANTRVVAIIALVVAGVFVMLGLSLSVVRAFQQRAAERRLAEAVQQRLAAQNQASQGSDQPEVERTHSSKVPWLVVGPDGIELAVAHKISLPGVNPTDGDGIKSVQQGSDAPATPLAMATSTAGLLANMHQHPDSQPSNAESDSDSIQALHWRTSDNPAYSPASQTTSNQPERAAVTAPAAITGPLMAGNTVMYRPHFLNHAPSRPLFTAVVETP